MGDEEEVYSVQYLDGDGETSTWLSRPGKCTISYNNGDTFEGYYARNDETKMLERVGQGKYTWTEANVHYTGSFSSNKRNGFGTCEYPNGDVYRGSWSGGKKNGKGTYKYAANGDQYSGSWKDDARQGHGAYVFSSNGSQLIGEWSSGRLVRGKWVYADGSSYHGSFDAAGRPTGTGLFYHRSGLVQRGEYVSEGKDEEDDEEAEGKEDPAFVGGEIFVSSTDPLDVTHAINSYAEDVPVRRAEKRKTVCVIFEGGPGSEISAVAQRVSKQLSMPVIAAEGLFEKYAADEESELGSRARDAVDAGGDDALLSELVILETQSEDARANGCIIRSGFPTTEDQAAALAEACEVRIIVISVSEEDAVARCTGRRTDPETGESYHIDANPPPDEIAERCVQSEDDSEDRVRERLAEYDEREFRVESQFGDGSVAQVDGSGSADEAAERACKIISE